MTHIHHSFAPVHHPRRSSTALDGHRPPTPAWNGVDPSRVDGRRWFGRAKAPASLMSKVDDCNSRMARDPQQAFAIYKTFLEKVQASIPGIEQRVQGLPLMTGMPAIRKHLQGLGPELRQQAQALGRAPIFIAGATRGARNEPAAFNASLREAHAAGIRRLVIDQPDSMAELDALFGGPVVQMMRQGDPDGLRALFRQRGTPFTRTIAAFIHCADNVREARRKGFEVSFLDFAHLHGKGGDARAEAMAKTLVAMAGQGEGVMASVPAFGVGDLAMLAGVSGAPLQAVSFLPERDAEASLCMGRFDEIGARQLPNFSVLRLADRPFAGRAAGQPRMHPPLGGHRAPHGPHGPHGHAAQRHDPRGERPQHGNMPAPRFWTPAHGQPVRKRGE